MRLARLFQLHGPDSHRSAGMSHAPIKLTRRQGDAGTRGQRNRCLRVSASPCPRVSLFWCPRKDLNLQPLVCRTSAPSVELLGQAGHGDRGRGDAVIFRPRVPASRCLRVRSLVGVGIEPTSIPFQGIANPSQLSDPGHCRLSIGLRSLAFGLWSLAFGLDLRFGLHRFQRPKTKDPRPKTPKTICVHGPPFHERHGHRIHP